MKKILSLLLALMLLVAFAACGGTEEETEGGAETAAQTQGTTAETETETETEEPEQSETETEEPEQSETETEEPEQSETETEEPATTDTESTDTESTDTESTGGSTDPEGYEPEDGDVLFFTPKLDGLLDDEYLKSARYVGGRTLYGTTAAPTTEDFLYFLWDGEYFYVCAIVYDEDIVTRGEKYVNEAVNQNPYCNDVIELWYTFNGDAPDSIAMVKKACLDAYGYKVFSNVDEGILSEHFSEIKGAATRHIDEENPEKSYYICEFQFPCKNEFGQTLDVGAAVYFASQVDDIARGLNDVVTDVEGVMGKGAGAEITLGYADDYASGKTSDGYIIPTTPENSLVGFNWTNSRSQYPDLDTGDMKGWIELILLETTPEDVDDQYADEFPTRLYELEIAQ